MCCNEGRIISGQRAFMSGGDVTNRAGGVGIMVMQPKMMHNQKLGAQPDANNDNRMTGVLTHVP